MTENDDPVPSGQSIFGQEHTAELGSNAEHAEEVGTYALPPKFLCAAVKDEPPAT